MDTRETNGRRNRERSGVTGLAVPGGLLLGIGIGILLGTPAAGALIGLGGGLIGMMVMRAVVGDW